MFELAWKEIHPNGNQPIHQKSFRTAERRQDFIDSFPDGDIRFEITSMSAEDSHTISDFHSGMRVRIKNASLHPENIGKAGVVEKTVKRDSMVWIKLESGQRYGAFAWNLEID